MCDAIASYADWLDDRKSAVMTKHAILVAVFFIFLIFLVSTIVANVCKGKKDKENLQRAMERLSDHIGYECVIIFFLTLVGSVNAPNVLTALLLYIFLVSMILQGVSFITKKYKLTIVSYVIQLVVVFGLGISCMADNWCRFLRYRHAVNN